MADTTEAAGSSSPDTGLRGRTKIIRRVFLIVVALVAAWQILATFLWIAPPSGLRELIPGNLLQRYMIPMFGQSWSVFAPDPINGDYRLEVRAVVKQGKSEQTTRWVDATAAELALEHHHLFPPRAAIQSSELASEYKSAYDNLSADHKAVVALGYFKGDDWQNRLQTKLDSYGDTQVVGPYIAQEDKVIAYSTQVAEAAFGKGVVEVQFAISRQNVVPFQDRNVPNVQRPPVQTAPTGWRGTIVRPGQSSADFAATFRRAMAESGQ